MSNYSRNKVTEAEKLTLYIVLALFVGAFAYTCIGLYILSR